MKIQQLKDLLKGYFNLQPYLEDEAQAKQSIIDGVSFRGPNIVILIIAIVIASVGLNTNSAAVVIGAMLISPLMGPIIGIGLGAGIYDYALIKRSGRNLLAAAAFSVLASTIYFLISPVSEGHSELLARTSPTIYDVLIGFFGGLAGIVAIACKQKGNVIPGVAIATALLPPLCTAGYGLATLQMNYFTGALYLFCINSIFIALSTLLGVKFFKFAKFPFVNVERRKKVRGWITAIAIATLLPSIYLTVLMIRESFFVSDANDFIENEVNVPNTQVFAKKVYMKHWKKYMEITLIGQRVNIDSLHLALTEQLDRKPMLRGTSLTIKQGFAVGGMVAASNNDGLSSMFDGLMSQLNDETQKVDALKQELASMERFDSISYQIAPEIKAVFPEISYISIDRGYVCDVANSRLDTLNIAIIQHTDSLKDTDTLIKYLEARTGLRNVHIIDAHFPLTNTPPAPEPPKATHDHTAQPPQK